MNDPDFDVYAPPKASIRNQDQAARNPTVTRTEIVTAPVEGNPWLTMWIWPRGTIRAIVDSDPSQSVPLLAGLFGVAFALAMFRESLPGERTPRRVDVAMILIVSAVLGNVGHFLLAVLIRRTGSWLGGRASLAECRAAIAWGCVPQVVRVGLLLAMIAVLREHYFRANEFREVDMTEVYLANLVGWSQRILGIWTLVLVIRAVAEVHRISTWWALVAFMLAVIICVAALFLFSMVMDGFRGFGLGF